MTEILYAVLYTNLSRVVDFDPASTLFDFDFSFESKKTV